MHCQCVIDFTLKIARAEPRDSDAGFAAAGVGNDECTELDVACERAAAHDDECCYGVERRCCVVVVRIGRIGCIRRGRRRAYTSCIEHRAEAKTTDAFVRHSSDADDDHNAAHRNDDVGRAVNDRPYFFAIVIDDDEAERLDDESGEISWHNNDDNHNDDAATDDVRRRNNTH